MTEGHRRVKLSISPIPSSSSCTNVIVKLASIWLDPEEDPEDYHCHFGPKMLAIVLLFKLHLNKL